MIEDLLRSRAATYVDDEFLRSQDFLFREHRRHEQRELAFHKTQLQGFLQTRADAEQRHWHRMRAIDEKQRKAEIALYRRHTSIIDRLATLTKKGRARQAEQPEAPRRTRRPTAPACRAQSKPTGATVPGRAGRPNFSRLSAQDVPAGKVEGRQQ